MGAVGQSAADLQWAHARRPFFASNKKRAWSDPVLKSDQASKDFQTDASYVYTIPARKTRLATLSLLQANLVGPSRDRSVLQPTRMPRQVQPGNRAPRVPPPSQAGSPRVPAVCSLRSAHMGQLQESPKMVRRSHVPRRTQTYLQRTLPLRPEQDPRSRTVRKLRRRARDSGHPLLRQAGLSARRTKPPAADDTGILALHDLRNTNPNACWERRADSHV
jgi:hypothetical protein